jgi:uncharacterized protein YeaC (DUF1315 family)
MSHTWNVVYSCRTNQPTNQPTNEQASKSVSKPLLNQAVVVWQYNRNEFGSNQSTYLGRQYIYKYKREPPRSDQRYID